MDPRLAEAARSGNIDRLYDLLRESPYLLENIEAVPFINIPLHEAVISKKTRFFMEMMNLKPSFARKLNPDGFSPLHLAIGTSVTSPSWPWVVRRLLEIDPSLALVKGREGMTPILLAAKNGASHLVVYLLLACPKCCQDVNVDGQTILHIAVENGKIEVLEALIGWLGRSKEKSAASTQTEVLNKEDRQGNTALHVAAYENKYQELRMLLKAKKIDPNIKNHNGLTVLDVLQRQGQMDTDTKKCVLKSGAMEANSLPKNTTMLENLSLPLSKFQRFIIGSLRYRAQLTEETRNALLLLSTLVIAINCQMILQPPGGLSNGRTVMKTSIFRAVWMFNCLGFLAAVNIVLFMVQAEASKLLFYFPVLPSIFAAFAVAGWVISPNAQSVLEKHPVISCVGVITIPLYFSWRLSGIK